MHDRQNNLTLKIKSSLRNLKCEIACTLKLKVYSNYLGVYGNIILPTI